MHEVGHVPPPHSQNPSGGHSLLGDALSRRAETADLQHDSSRYPILTLPLSFLSCQSPINLLTPNSIYICAQSTSPQTGAKAENSRGSKTIIKIGQAVGVRSGKGVRTA